MPETSPAKPSRRSTWLTVSLFLVFALLYALTVGRYTGLAGNILAPSAEGPPSYGFALSCTEIHTCMRVGVSLFGQAATALFDVVSDLLFMHNSSSSLILESPWGRPEYGATTRALATMTAANVTVKVICLLPLLFLTLSFFRTVVARVLFLTGAFLTLAGWPPPLLDGLFSVLRLFADWPLSYYLFSYRLNPYDFGSLGFICLLALYIARRRHKSLCEIAAITLLGQLVFENNGMVAGIAFFLDALLDPAHGPVAVRGRIALARLGIAAAVTVVLIGGFVVLYSIVNPGATDTGFDSILSYVQTYWRDYGSNNFRWWNVTIANFLTLVLVPTIVGLVIGAFCVFAGRNDSRRVADDLRAATAAAGGFFSTVLVGLFVSGLSSDMGRQLLPLTLMVLTLAAKAGERSGLRRFSARAD